MIKYLTIKFTLIIHIFLNIPFNIRVNKNTKSVACFARREKSKKRQPSLCRVRLSTL